VSSLATFVSAIPLTRALFSGRHPLYFRGYLWFDSGMGIRLRPRAIDHFRVPAYRLLRLGGAY
jgi:hypothetical protein